MLRRFAWTGLLATGLCAGLPAAAHHGWSEYDGTKALNLTGTIRESAYEHPHGHLGLEAPRNTWCGGA